MKVANTKNVHNKVRDKSMTNPLVLL